MSQVRRDATHCCSVCSLKPDEIDARGKRVELRPYGPGGALICCGCAMEPERKAETERNFHAQLDAAGPVAIIGEETGPRPLDGGKQ